MGIKTYVNRIITYTFAFGKWRKSYSYNNTSLQYNGRFLGCRFHLGWIHEVLGSSVEF